MELKWGKTKRFAIVPKPKTFKVSDGGEDIGVSLPVQAVDANSPNKVETLKDSTSLGITLGKENGKRVKDIIYELVKSERDEQRESDIPSFLQQSIGERFLEETDEHKIGVETSFQDILMEDASVASIPSVQSEVRVTIKAKYGDDFIRFLFSASSGIDHLNQQVSKRLGLGVGTFILKYRDEDNDLILLICDEDVQYYISSSIKQGKYTLIVLIVPK